MVDFVPQLTEAEFQLLERTAMSGERSRHVDIMECLSMFDSLAGRGLLLFHQRPRAYWRTVASIVEALVERPGPEQVDDGSPRPHHPARTGTLEFVVHRIYVEVVAAQLGWVPGSVWGAA
jgi:hypothetical protein